MTTRAGLDNPWICRYRDALEAALEARSLGDRAAFGFNNDVDVIVRLSNQAVRRVLEATTPTAPADRKPARIEQPGDLVSALRYLMARGSGDVIYLSAEMSAWAEASFPGRYQLGGNGAQAANTLSYLGFECLLHPLTLSPLDASVFDPSGRILVAGPDGLRPLPDAVRPDDRPALHFIFEYGTGDCLRLGGTDVVAPRANRLITLYNPLLETLPIDPAFVDAVADPQSRVRSVMVSGFGRRKTLAALEEKVAEVAGYVAGWRAARPGLIAYWEMVATPDLEFWRRLEPLASQVDSIGFNEDEAACIAEAWGLPEPDSFERRVGLLRAMRDRLGVSRVGLHTQTECLTLTALDPRVELNTVLFASLTASTRARIGRFPTVTDLSETLSTGQSFAPAPQGMDEGIAPHGDAWLVWVPTPLVSHPAGTVGLGDTFAGALMVLMDR